MIATLESAIDEMLTPLAKLSRDVKLSAKLLSPSQARWLVDAYYQLQDYRKRAGNQNRAMGESGEPHEVVQFVFAQMESLENSVRRALGAWADSQVPGIWAQTICGIGPVLSAGFLAHLDIEQAPTVGHFWRFAGQDSSNQWLGKDKAAALVKETLNGAKTVTTDHVAQIAVATNRKAERVRAWDAGQRKLVTDMDAMTPASLAAGLARRPWNARLKVLCWLAGESFVKVSNNPQDIYGHIYAERKAEEQERNERREYAEQAARILTEKRIGKDTEAYKHYSEGRLPPAHIHARAKRKAVKIFLAHLHHVMYESHFGKPPPFPYVISHLGHAHYLQPPNWPL